jgi:hypothetical protein
MSAGCVLIAHINRFVNAYTAGGLKSVASDKGPPALAACFAYWAMLDEVDIQSSCCSTAFFGHSLFLDEGCMLLICAAIASMLCSSFFMLS